MNRSIATIEEMDLKGRRVFLRVDFNVPLRAKSEGAGYEVADSSRIIAALDTIRFVIEAGGKVILASHLGRPKGKPEKKYSLEPVGQKLSELLEKEVILTEDCIGDGPRGLSHQMRPGDILLLENLRFHPGEEDNAPDFAARLMELCDVYVSDAFGTLHRAHASTAGLPKLVAEKGIGFLVEKELHYLEPLKESPERPFYLIMGGAKVSDKIKVVENFFGKVDKVFIGGAMAYAFLKAQGHTIGTSLCDDKQMTLAMKLLKSADVRNIKICLPIDHVISTNIQDTKNITVTEGIDIPYDRMGLDIGPKTRDYFRKELSGAKLIFWNGPMGVFEQPAFANGTFEMAKMISESDAKKLAGGGDSTAAIAKSGVEDKFDFISTGGGATLEFLEGQELPGLKSLELFARA